MKRLLLLLACLTLAHPASAQIVNFQRLIGSVDARTIASNGSGTPATLTLTPTASYVTLTCNDTDGCTITLGETAIPNGMSVLIVNVSANTCTFSDTSGVSELTGTIALTQWQTLALEYVTDRWVQAGTGGGAGTVTTTGSPASGELAKFSGASSVTTANLTGDVTTSGTVATTIANDAVSNAKLRNSGALSVIGRSANSSGDPGDISASAASDAVLRESGSTLGFGTIATAGISNDAVTFAKMQNASGASVLVGRGSASGAGDLQEIALGAGLSMAGTTISSTVVGTGGGDVVGPSSATDNCLALFDGTTGKLVKDCSGVGTTTQVLHGNAAGAPTYGAVSLTADVSGDLPYANLAQGSALSVLGVTGNATADNASIAAGTDNQVLRRSGTALAFGAVNLASSNAVTGILPIANIATGTPDGTKFVRDDGTLQVPSVALSASTYLQYRDEKTQNTAGGTCTSGAWQTRTINTEVTDTGAYGALSANQITLSAGTYMVRASAPAFQVDRHQVRLQNVTDATTLLVGTSEYTNDGQNTVRSTLAGVFTVAASKALELQHRCQTTHATNGFGVEANFTTEVYSVVELWKIQ